MSTHGDANDGAPDTALWDVVEEHFAEAQFLFEQLGRAFESPVLTLDTVARGVEARLLAHVDALWVGGPAVYDALIRPALAEPDPTEPAVAGAAALVAVVEGHFGDLAPALGHEARGVRDAVVDACLFAGGSALDTWLRGAMDSGSDRQRVTRAQVMARRGLEVPPLIAWLQGGNAELACDALRAARGADARRHLPVVEYALAHANAEVREAALTPALIWGSDRARAACAAWALERPARSVPVLLLGVLGDAARLSEVVARAPREALSAPLFALGIAGDVGSAELLLRHAEGADPVLAKIAAQSLSMLLGVDLQAPEIAAPSPKPDASPAQLPPPEADPEAQAALPRLEDDDLDADLVPPRESELPDFHPPALRRACEGRLRGLPSGTRILGGRPLGSESLLDLLLYTPTRRRETLATVLAVRTAGRVRIDTRGRTSDQLGSLAAAKGNLGQRRRSARSPTARPSSMPAERLDVRFATGCPVA